ncbi:hypothetical protein T07_1589 [Trichinella nelsoni]|uniref:Uncharacterized protein n=1 Tax=Trichinella nelsoni TaxID=6336 RepID=A0A0V0RZ04_9BILA|nr:hypothetical protein T07_1589 [Trichinella nelsoni]
MSSVQCHTVDSRQKGILSFENLHFKKCISLYYLLALLPLFVFAKMTRCCWDMRHLAQVRRGTALDIPSRYTVKHSHEIFGQSTVVDPRTCEYSNVKLRKSLARRTPKPLHRKVSGPC